MKKIYTMTEEENTALHDISNILSYIEGTLDDICDDEDFEFTDCVIKDQIKSMQYWSLKADTTLRAILSDRYNQKDHNLSKFELPN